MNSGLPGSATGAGLGAASVVVTSEVERMREMKFLFRYICVAGKTDMGSRL